MSFDRIATLTLNPAIDLSLHTDTLRHESLNRVLSEREEAGGKGVNVSRLLSRLDVPHHAVALCGLENLPHYQSLLPDEVDFRPIPFPGKIRENITLTSQDGTLIKLDRSGTFSPGDALPRLEALLLSLFSGISSGLLLVCGSLPNGLAAQEVCALLSRIASLHPVRLGLDTLAFSLPQLQELRPLFLKPNEYELAKLLGIEGGTRELSALAGAARRLPAAFVLVSLGERGLLGVKGEEAWLVPGLAVPVRSTVAAGDSTVAGFSLALQRDMPFPQALRLAAACGTAAVTKPGSGMGGPEEIKEYFSKLTVEAVR